MSYCRFSSDGFQCDLYCYEAADGYYTHVAQRRHKEKGPVLTEYIKFESPSAEDKANPEGAEPKWDEKSLRDYNAAITEWQRRQDELTDDERYDFLEFEGAGETFVTPTLEEFKKVIETLTEVGANVPEGLIEMIEGEISLMGKDHSPVDEPDES